MTNPIKAVMKGDGKAGHRADNSTKSGAGKNAARAGKRVDGAKFAWLVTMLVLVMSLSHVEGFKRCWCSASKSAAGAIVGRDATIACCRNSADSGKSGTFCDISDISAPNKNYLNGYSGACVAFNNQLDRVSFGRCCSYYTLSVSCDAPSENTCRCAGSSACRVF